MSCKYLAATHLYRLTDRKNDPTELIGYSDSNWGGDTDDGCSTTGYSFILGGGTIAWAAQKQLFASTKAEYMTLTECSKHAQWTIFLTPTTTLF